MNEASLRAQPGTAAHQGPAGLQRLDPGSPRGALLDVSPAYRQTDPSPFVPMLRVVGGNATGALAPLLPFAPAGGLLVLAPESRRQTWDMPYGGYGPDVECIDSALSQVVGRYSIDSRHVSVEGFSDGASYRLSLGPSTGLLCRRVIAFSPRFMGPCEEVGEPRVFITHGTINTVLPTSRCRPRTVPALRKSGCDVEYREFEGRHAVPPSLAQEAVRWFLGDERVWRPRLASTVDF